MRSRFALLLLVPLLGCGDSGNEMDFGGEEIGPDRHAMLSEEGDVKMGLTDRYVYLALSDSIVADARSEMRGDTSEGKGGLFGQVLEGTVGKALSFRAKLLVSEIEDVRWEDDRMRVVFTDPDRTLGENFQVDDRPIDEAFAEDDVREFGEALRRVKAEGADF